MLRAFGHSLSFVAPLSLLLGCAETPPAAQPPQPEEPVASPGPVDVPTAPTAAEAPAAPTVAKNEPAPAVDPELSSDLVIEQKLDSGALPGTKGTYVVGASACADNARHVLLRIERPGVAARQADLGAVVCKVTKKGKSITTSRADEPEEPVRFEVRTVPLDPTTTGFLVDIFKDGENAYHWSAVLLSRAESLREGWGELQGRSSGPQGTEALVVRPNGELWATSVGEWQGKDWYRVEVLSLDAEGNVQSKPHPVSLARAGVASRMQVEADAAADALKQKCPALAKRLGKFEAPGANGQTETWLGVASPTEEETKQAMGALAKCGVKDAAVVTLPAE